MIRILVRIQIELPFLRIIFPVKVLILQLARNSSDFSRFHIRHSAVNGVVRRIRLRADSDENHCIGQRQARFRKANLQRLSLIHI